MRRDTAARRASPMPHLTIRRQPINAARRRITSTLYAAALAGFTALAGCQPDSQAAASFVTAPELSGPAFAAGGKNSLLPRIETLALQSTTIQIGTLLPYTLTLTNPGAPQAGSWILGELVQAGKTWAGGTGTQCPEAAFATIPTGSCTFEFQVHFPDEHKLKPGSAKFVLRLLQEDPDTGRDKEFDRVSVDVILTN